MKKKFFLLFFLLLNFLFLHSQIPPQPFPPRLVNDFAHLLTLEEINRLENRLITFNDSTSNVICIVTTDDLNGYSASEFAYEIGDQWGVKETKFNNGVVILIKPKNETNGEVYIAVGYDLEPVLTDAQSKRLIDNVLIPNFKQNRYYDGLEQALNIILPLISGEISEKRGGLSGVKTFIIFIVIFLLLFLILFIAYKKGKGNNSSGGSANKNSNFWKWMLWSALLSGRQSGGRNSSSGGGFGSSSGGFGGFGGRGGFGGGGAGGKW